MWDIVIREKGSAEGFVYSGAFAAFGGDWNVRTQQILLKPKDITGTKMNYNGIKKDQDRADLIKWLSSLAIKV